MTFGLAAAGNLALGLAWAGVFGFGLAWAVAWSLGVAGFDCRLVLALPDLGVCALGLPRPDDDGVLTLELPRTGVGILDLGVVKTDVDAAIIGLALSLVLELNATGVTAANVELGVFSF